MKLKNLSSTILKADKMHKITIRGVDNVQITTGYSDRIHFNFEEITTSLKERRYGHVINNINLENPFLQEHDVDVISRAIIKSSYLNHSLDKYDKYDGWVDISISPETKKVIVENIEIPVEMVEGESIKTKINVNVLKAILATGATEILLTIGKQEERSFSFIATNFDSCSVQIIMLEE